MKMPYLEFCDFCWQQNPTTLSVSHARQTQVQSVPYLGDIVQDFGKRRITVTGEGVFVGDRAISLFQQLSQFYREETVGVLKLLGLPPIMAKLVELELVGKINPDKVGYRFVFWEDMTTPLPKSAQESLDRGYVVAGEADNLWQIANESHTTVERLLSKNPTIQWPGYLKEGQKVMLP